MILVKTTSLGCVQGTLVFMLANNSIIGTPSYMERQHFMAHFTAQVGIGAETELQTGTCMASCTTDSMSLERRWRPAQQELD